MSWAVWLTRWEVIPSIWTGCALALAAYPLLPGARWNGRAAAWVGGVAVVFVALCSALDIVGDQYLFSVHMAQHLALAMVAPPLLIRGLPDAAIDTLLASWAGPAVRAIVNPIPAASLYFIVLVAWHVPIAFDFAVTHELVHVIQHLSFLAVGLVFWWAVIIHRPHERWNLSDLGEVAYLTAGALPSVVVGLTIALLRHPVYAYYLTRSPRLGVSPLSDQLVGGLLMFGFDNCLMVGVAGYYFWRLLEAGEDGAATEAAV